MFEIPEPPVEEVPPFEAVPPFDPEDCGPEELEAFAGLADLDEYDGDGMLPDPDLEGLAAAALADLENAWQAARDDELDADGTLAEAVASRQAERRVLARRLWLAVHWADLHAVLERPWVTTPGAERLVRMGGDGTPQVADLAPAELGAVLGTSDSTATGLVADALDLRHRFPLLWSLVQAGQVEVWLARKTAAEARTLTQQAAAKVDARVAGLAGTLTWPRLRTIVTAAVLAADPPQAIDDAERAAEQAGVFVDPEPTGGYLAMMIRAAAGDVKALDESLDLISRALKILGDTRDPQPRRATAVGIIANPHAALDLLTRAEHVRQTHREAAAARRNGDHQLAETIAASLPDGVDPDGRCGNQRPFTFTTAILYYHLTRDAVDKVLAGEPFAGAAVGRVEDLGPLILDQITAWLQHANVTVKPVIDLAGIPPVDHYEVPDRISEAIRLIRTPDSFPYATSTSGHQDTEHTIPYLPMSRGGPPGQTDPLKMSLMTRRHHRIKTFSGWTVTQPRPGAWLHRSPHGYHYLVDQHGTTPLGKLDASRRLRCGS